MRGGRGGKGGQRESIYIYISMRSTRTWPGMSPSPAQCARRKAAWERMEPDPSIPAADPGGGPVKNDGGNRPLNPPAAGPPPPAALRSPGWGLRAAPPNPSGSPGCCVAGCSPLGTARRCPLPSPGSAPGPGCCLGPHLQDGQTWPAACEAKGLGRGVSHGCVVLLPAHPD